VHGSPVERRAHVARCIAQIRQQPAPARQRCRRCRRCPIDAGA
jgi:hypothetical protein